MPGARDTTEAARGDGCAAPGHRVPGWAWWAGGAVLALVAGGIAIGVVNSTVYSPEARVQDYLDALSAGDGGTAMALASGSRAGAGSDTNTGAGAELPAGTATSLLQGAPLQDGMAALGELTVTRGPEAPDGASAEVAVGYTVDGEDHRTTFTVERTGRDWLFFDRWELAAVPVQTVEVALANLPPEAAAGPVTATVNGVQSPLTPPDDPGSAGNAEQSGAGQGFAVLPPFVVDAEFESTYLAAEPVRLVVDQSAPAGQSGPDQPARPEPLPLELSLRYTDAVSGEVNRQLDAYLASCTEQKVLQPAGCPMGYDTVNRIPPDSIAWTVPGDPEATVLPLPAQGGDPTVMAPLEAEAVLTLQEIDLVTGERQSVEHRDPFTLDADLAVTPESVSLTPRVP